MSLFGHCLLICDSYVVTEMEGDLRLPPSSRRELRCSGLLRSE
jgi:hypothetical protein